MLLQFNATNFGAFRDTFSLNMTPAKITEFPDSLITDTDDVSAIPLAGFYGANGCGKSTVLKALHYLSRCILSPSQALPEDHRFAFGHEAADAVTEFEMLFRAGRMEYDYQLRLLPGTVLEENLFARSFSDPSYDVVFDRDGEGVYLGALVDGVDVSSLEDDTPMLAFLIQQTRLSWLPAVSGFFEGISWLSCSAISEDVLTPYLSDTRAMKKLTGLISRLDLSVTDFYREDGEIFCVHTVGKSSYALPLSEEGSGVRQLLLLCAVIQQKLASGGILLADDLYLYLHPRALRFLLSLFASRRYNRAGAQLLFTSYDMPTMHNSLLRRDEIWLVEKGADQCASLYTLALFLKENGEKVRKDEIYYKQFLEGRYGAAPRIDEVK